jgi:hypothetical protein
MFDFVLDFAVFLLVLGLIYLAFLAVLICFYRQEVTDQMEQHLESIMLPVTVEFDNNQFYCYNKQSQEFMAQGATYDEIKNALQARFSHYILYVEGGDPEVLYKLLGKHENSIGK